MRLRIFAFISSILFNAVTFQVFADTDEQLAAIEHLGQLNGVALQCKYVDQTRHIKQALVAVLPKQRNLGQVFQDATNKSFLEFIEQGGKCPAKDVLGTRIDSGVVALGSVFQN